MTIITEDALLIGKDARTQVESWLWVMDDHKWAIVAWEKVRKTPQQRFDLVHIDYHWDGVNDFYGKEEEISKLQNLGIEDIENLVSENNGIQFDSFIAPAVLRGYIETISFVCFQGEDDGEEGIDKEALEIGRTTQNIYSRPSEIPKANNPLIFDFCLDVFNKSDKWCESDLWSQEEIAVFLVECRPFVQSAELVTFSISYGYSGAEEDARNLAKHVLNQFIEWRK